MSDFKPAWLATGVGSMPLAEAGPAVDLILDRLPEIPFWPQLIARSPWEEMTLQFAPGLPGLEIDPAGRRVRLDPGLDRSQALVEFYEADLSQDWDHFALTEETAAGFFEMVKRAAEQGSRMERLKGQVAGPVTFGLAVKDSSGRPLLYDRELAEACARGLGLKGAWQIRNFPPGLAPGIIFLDEPALTGFGSAFMSLEFDQAKSLLEAAAAPIRQAGGLAGVHICGNTDWSLPLTSELDLVNFDAYDYGQGLTLYPKEIAAFLERGGLLAWGLVPTQSFTGRQTTGELIAKLEELIGALVRQGLDRNLIRERSLITPACGLGSLRPDQAEAILDLLAATSRLLRGEKEPGGEAGGC